jgi:hypothetical protein
LIAGAAAILIESELDAKVLDQVLGFDLAAAASPNGARPTLSDRQSVVLRHCDPVLIAHDNNPEGEAAANKLITLNPTFHRACPPAGHKSVADAYTAGVDIHVWALKAIERASAT